MAITFARNVFAVSNLDAIPFIVKSDNGANCLVGMPFRRFHW